jgi:cytochrome c oxidase subunit 4
MSSSHHHDSHDVQKEVKKYIAVFVALLLGTVITVGLYYVYFQSVAVTVAVALFIASVKAFLVAGFFMHLISERKMIYGILASTIFFFAGMMYLTVWSMNPESLIH